MMPLIEVGNSRRVNIWRGRDRFRSGHNQVELSVRYLYDDIK